MTTPTTPEPEIQDATAAGALVVTRQPEIVLEEARHAARALKDVIDKKARPVKFNNETYLEFEDWQTVGRFYGIAVRIAGTKYVTYDDVRGFEATAEAVHVETGKLVSSAEAMCLNDEEKWRARAKYEWVYVKKSGGHSVEDPGKDELIWEAGQDGKRRPKKERLKTGEEAVPLFQLRSMAQTRAGAKALRNALAWVVVLAGYRPTPAEELPGSGVDDKPDPTGGDVPFAYEETTPPGGNGKPRQDPPPPAKPKPDDGLARQYAAKILTIRAAFSRQPNAQTWDKIVKHFTGKMYADDQLAAAPVERLEALHQFMVDLASGKTAALALAREIMNGTGAS